MMKKLFTVSLFNFLSKVMAALLVLATQVYITHHYAVNDLADYSKLINYINIATVITGAGLNISAIYHLRKGLLNIAQVFKWGLRAFVLTAAAAFFILIIAGLPVADAVLISLYSFLNNIFFLHNGRVIAEGRFARYNLQLLLYAGVNLAAIAIMYFTGNSIGIRNLLMCQCAFLIIINAVYWQKSSSGSGIVNVTQPGGLFSYGRRIFIVNTLGILLYSGDIILLDFMLPDTDFAEYLLAATAIKFLWLGIDSIGLVIFPEFVRSSTDIPAVRSMNRLFVAVGGILFVALFGFYFAGEYIVRFIYGDGFGRLRELLMLLMVATFGVVLYKFLSRYFAANDSWWPIYVSLAAGIVSEVILLVIWVPSFGVLGAAYASLGAYLLTGTIIAVWYYVSVRKYQFAML